MTTSKLDNFFPMREDSYIEPKYTTSMTLIVGKICDDGVILGGDSKAYDNINPPTYDNKKIFEIGRNKAIAFAGKYIHGKFTANSIAGSARALLKHRDMELEALADALKDVAYSHTYMDDTRIGIILADSRELYTIDVSSTKWRIEKVTEEGAMPAMGIDDVKLLPKPKTNTLKDTEPFIRELIAINTGDFVGGDTQIAILER